MIIHEIEQGTPEWHALRKGKLTASNATAIGNNGAGLKTYVDKIVLNMVKEEEQKTSKDIERGNELEPIARLKYEFEKGVQVREVGFIQHCEHSGYSPDGLVGDDGLIEIKARNNANHFKLITSDNPAKAVSSDARWQMQMGMLVSGRKWCDFISYNPNFKHSLFVYENV